MGVDQFLKDMEGVLRIQREMEAKHGPPPAGHVTASDLEAEVRALEKEVTRERRIGE